jgi:prophage regulatory protein
VVLFSPPLSFVGHSRYAHTRRSGRASIDKSYTIMSAPSDNAAREAADVTRSHEIVHRLPVVITRTGLKRSSIYAYMDRGDFPLSIPLGKRAVGWLKSEIDRWIEERAAAAAPRRSRRLA